VLDDVRHTGVVTRRGSEAEREQVLRICRFQMHDLAAGAGVPEMHAARRDTPEDRVGKYVERADSVTGFPWRFEYTDHACPCLRDRKPWGSFMLYWRAMAGSIRRSILAHARFIRSIRAYFSDHGYAEVDTPCLCPYLVPEPAIEVFSNHYLPSRGAEVPFGLPPLPSCG